MHRRRFLSTLGLGAAALTALPRGAWCQTGSRPPRIVATRDGAYQLGKIEPLLTSKVRQVFPAPEGRYALAPQILRPTPNSPSFPPEPGEEKLWLYDALRGTTKLLYRFQDALGTKVYRSIQNIVWFPGTHRALVTQEEVIEGAATRALKLWLVDAERGTLRPLTGLPDGTGPSGELEDKAGLLLSWVDRTAPEQADTQSRFYAVLSPTGQLSPPARISYKGTSFGLRGLSVDHKRYFVHTYHFPPKVDRPEEVWREVTIATGAVTVLPKAPAETDQLRIAQAPPEPTLGLRSVPSKLVGEAGLAAETSALWLEARAPSLEPKYLRCLVAAETDPTPNTTYLLADSSAVLYLLNDALYAVPLASIGRPAFEKFLQERALASAAQVASCLQLLAQDHDGTLPGTSAELKAGLALFLKDSDIVAEFVYTYTSTTALSKLPNPSTTALGHIPAPGGRALIYADGRTKWEPNTR